MSNLLFYVSACTSVCVYFDMFLLANFNFIAVLLYYYFISIAFSCWLRVLLMLLSIKRRWTPWALLVLQHRHTFATATDLLICSFFSAHLLKLLPSNSGRCYCALMAAADTINIGKRRNNDITLIGRWAVRTCCCFRTRQ